MSSSDSGSDADAVEPRELIELIELVCSKDISEFDLERAGFRLRIVKSQGAALPAAGVSVAPVELAAPVVSIAASAAAAEPVDEGLHVVTSPIVGTFFRASSPGAEPYVKVGDGVKKGQVLCIIEAMKLMNEIESDLSGVIVDVQVENGQPVEFGEPLFRIRPDR